jgi:hypothetical protein
MVGLREKRKARGDCQRCGRRRASGPFVTCLPCRLQMQAAYHRRRLSQRVSA